MSETDFKIHNHFLLIVLHNIAIIVPQFFIATGKFNNLEFRVATKKNFLRWAQDRVAEAR